MYGHGYRDFILKHPERKSAILRHMFWKIPIARGLRPLSRGKIEQPAFAAMMAGSILYGYFQRG